MSDWQNREYQRMALDLWQEGHKGDMGTNELIGYDYLIDPYSPWFALEERKLKVPFIYKELQWYLEGDMAADWIGDHAGVWKSVIAADGRAVSNYGAEAFRNGRLWKIAEMLNAEPMTRRAIIYFGMNAYVTTHDKKKDQPCANSIQFMVRDNELHTIVSQRSQDYIYGVSGDAVFMALLTNLVAAYLSIDMAPIKVQVASFHHYPKHVDMVHDLLSPTYYQIDWPFPAMLNEDMAERVMKFGANADTPLNHIIMDRSNLANE